MKKQIVGRIFLVMFFILSWLQAFEVHQINVQKAEKIKAIERQVEREKKEHYYYEGEFPIIEDVVIGGQLEAISEAEFNEYLKRHRRELK